MSTPGNKIEIPAAAGPGGQLRAARLDLKLSPEDVANILRLSSKQIVALENDDYASLPGPTYIRGYLRGYAQMLGLSPGRIIENYNQATTVAPPPDLAKLTVPEQPTINDYRVQLVTAAIAALVIGLALLWWIGREESPAPSESPTALSADQPAELGADTSIPPVSLAPDAGYPLADVPGTLTPPIAVEPPVPPSQKQTTPPAVATAALEAPAPTPEVTGPKGRLVLNAEQDCWVDVRDANDKKMYYGTIAAGRVVTLVGTAPLSVFLGNVDGVQVEYNGAPYDAKRHRQGPVSRFKLSELKKNGVNPPASGPATVGTN